MLYDLEADELEPLLLWSSSDANAAAVAVANASTATSSSTTSGAPPCFGITGLPRTGGRAGSRLTAPRDSTRNPGAAACSP